MDVITFQPLYMQRVWGGRELEKKYHRQLPDATAPYGESWEICDREDEQSLIRGGTHNGKTLGELWKNHREEIFGVGFENEARFPLLIKILDARDELSIQVHPPTELAAGLGGEPKTEMWYIAEADEAAKLYVGVKEGMTREKFAEAIEHGTVDQEVHALQPNKGDSIFIPSGRLHAIGAGFVIYEIQQNSDTTYRVFDWNRVGLDGQPRELHVEESLQCIDYTDTQPTMDTADGETLADCAFFRVDRHELAAESSLENPDEERFSIVTVVSGHVSSSDGRSFQAGDFLLMPKGADPLIADGDSCVLQTTIPR